MEASATASASATAATAATELSESENSDDDNVEPTDFNDSNPWPYLAELFTFIRKEENSVIMLCLSCKPKHKECKAYATSTSNLKKHISVSKIEFEIL